MFKLDEQKLREEFAVEDDSSIEPFDPMKVDADELHRVVDACLEREVITPPNPRAWLAVYPLSISEPEPLLSVNPGAGPLLLGGSVVFDVGDEKRDKVEESVVVLQALVEAANALYGESELAKAGLPSACEEERCENCLRVHGSLQACLIGVLAGCIEDREAIKPITAEELAAVAVDPLWDRFGGPAVDYLEALIVAVRAAGKVGPGGPGGH